MDRLSEIRARCEAAKSVVFVGVPMSAGTRDFLESAKADMTYLLAEVGRLHNLLAERNVLLDEYEASNRWIPVSEGLPIGDDADENGNVLVLRGADGYDMCAWDDVPDTWDVTHWRPLPEPPKEGE